MEKPPIRPEDTFEMFITAGTTKAKLAYGDVPANKFARKVYSWLFINQSSTPAGVTITIELGDTVEVTLPEIILPANGILTEESMAGLLTIPAGRNVKAQVTTGSGPVTIIMRVFDL